MKRRTTLSILIAMVLLVVTSFVVYAAFTVEEPFAGDVGYHEINDATISTSETDVLSYEFTAPGDKYNFTYQLENNDTKNYGYYYKFEYVGIAAFFEHMIYVYVNDTYVGVLSDFISSNSLLCEGSYIFTGESRSDKFTFELHNQAENYVSVGVSFKVSCFLNTTNVQENVYLPNDADVNDEYILKAIDDINRVPNKTLILTSNQTLDNEITIKQNVNIDLCGNTLTLNENVNIAENVVVNIYDSRSGADITGTGKFVLSNESSFINPGVSIEGNIQVDNFSTVELFNAFDKQLLDIISISSNVDYDFLKNYNIYYFENSNFSISSNLSKHSIIDGIYQKQELSTNEVLYLNVQVGDKSKDYEIKLIGSDSEIFESIINTNLAHLKQYESSNNGLQMKTDLYLPTSLREYNATISWWSSNQRVLSNDGRLLVGQGNVVLTATIKLYDKVYTKDYYIYAVQEDNLSKLKYLATQVEKGVGIINGVNLPPMTLTEVVHDTSVTGADIHYLPVAGTDNINNSYYYTNWTAGKELGIVGLSYELESEYYYISNDNTYDETQTTLLTNSCVYLNSVTYSKVARIKINGEFDNGDNVFTYITINIDLTSDDLAEEVWKDLQDYLDTVDVLQNILDTRAKDGVLNEKGDFVVPSKIESVDVRYSTPEKYKNLYEISVIDGEIKVVFKDLKYLSLSDDSVDIDCRIVTLDENGQETATPIATKTLRFNVPGAITTENFVLSTLNADGTTTTKKLFDFANNEDTKAIFYSFKYQTLQQSTENPLYNVIRDEDGNVTSSIGLVDKSITVADVYNLGEYILIYDIENTTELKFEYGDDSILINYYDLGIFRTLISWAINNDGNSVAIKEKEDLNKFIDSGLQWISSDGTSKLSDGEIAIILSYCERYPGFNTYWDEVIQIYDNKISESDKNKILDLLAEDQIFIAIMSWIRSDIHMTFREYLEQYYQDEFLSKYNTKNGTSYTSISELTDQNICDCLLLEAGFISSYNDALDSISNLEERIIVYYVMANHPTKYHDFYNEWKENIKRNADIVTTKTITTSTIDNSSGGSASIIKCYDPIFTIIMNWATETKNEDPGIALGSIGGLNGANLSIIFDATELDYSNYWLYTSSWGSDRDNSLTANEWQIILKYLSLLGINTVNYSVNDNTYSVNLATLNIANASTNIIIETIVFSFGGDWYKTGYILSNYLLNAIINAVNSKFIMDNATNFNTLLGETIKENTITNTSYINSKFDNTGYGLLISETDSEGNVYEYFDVTSFSEILYDNQKRLSYDEYKLLEQYLLQKYFTDDVDDKLKTLLIQYYTGGADMSFTMGKDKLTDSGYKEVLGTIEKNYASIEDVLEKVTTLTYADTVVINEFYDNLDTISSSELAYIANLYKDTDVINNMLTLLGQIVDTYELFLENGSYVAKEKAKVNRELTTDEQSYIETKIQEILGINEDTIDYKYVPLNQIGEEDFEAFLALRYYSNLTDLSFKGTSSTYLFDDSEHANKLFDIITSVTKSLESLTMNYTGLSNIESIDSLVTLLSLDLRFNYEKDNYEGLYDINSLLELTHNMEVEKEDYLLYLNVYGTDVNFMFSESIFAYLYQKNNSSELWYNDNGVETLYYPGNILSNESMAINLCSLLYDVKKINSTFLVLPSTVFGAITDNQGNVSVISSPVSWKMIESNGLVEYNPTSKIIYVKDSSLQGQIIISASVSYGTNADGVLGTEDDIVTYTRYFYISVGV